MSAETGVRCELWVNFRVGSDGVPEMMPYPTREIAHGMLAADGKGPYRVLVPVPAEVFPPTLGATVEEAAP